MDLRSRLRSGIAPVLVLLAAVLVAGCETSPSVLNPKGPVAGTESNLFWIILGIATFIFVAVTSVLLYSIVRFRDRPGMPEPRQISGNNKLEIAWTIAPSIVLFVVLIFTITYMFSLAEPTSASGNTLHIRAIGHQWWWEFQYEDSTGSGPMVVTGDELEVPVGTVVHVDLVSDNVIHSLWIPQLAGKTDVIPGHNNQLWFKADAKGTYRGECAEYCGFQHAHMDFIVVALPQDQYTTWLQGQQLAAIAPTTDAQTAGQAAFKALGCTGCHQINSVNVNTRAVGPNLTHFGSRQLIAGGVLSNTQDNLTTWLNGPQVVKPGSDMVLPITPSAQQVSDLVAYLESLK
ncbi:MAG TPA: cytochrome c oxidase subunit II [Ktedonobacterales bacterium]|nr:cytochrome c oxidase subunit II [Ktedonobacterales bacterium]